MKTCIILACLVAGCLSFPFSPSQQRRALKDQSVNRMKQVLRSVSPQLSSKRAVKDDDPVMDLFTMMDTNNNGLISGHEYASFYSKPSTIEEFHLDSFGLDFSYSEWKFMFDLAAPVVDVNNTPNMLEVEELRTLARMGQGKK